MSIAQYIDHTLLKVNAAKSDIEKICQEAIEYKVYSVCVNPFWVKTAYQNLKKTGIKTCSVVGFPLGSTNTSVTLAETELAIAHGAREIDMVMNVGAFKSGDYSRVFEGIVAVTKLAHMINPDVLVKVIVESAVLTDEEKKTVASLVVNAGADFLKTSTGFVKNDHLLEDVKLFLDVLPKGFKVKAAGGIHTYEMAKQLIDLGVARIGASSTKQLLAEEAAALAK